MSAWVALLLAGAVLTWPSRRGRPPLPPGVGPSRQNGTAHGHGSAGAGRARRGAAAGPFAALGRHGRSAAREAKEEVVLQLVATMVPALRAGLPPSRAVQLAGDVLLAGSAGDDPTTGRWRPRERSVAAEARQQLDRLLRAAARGEPLGPHWHDWARSSGATGLAVLAQAWSLSERTGAPLADGVATAGAAVRAARDTRRAVAAASAGARATMNLLTALPLGGVALAAAVGIAPTRLYASTPAQGALAVGGCLLLLGRWWVARLTRSAVRPERAT